MNELTKQRTEQSQYPYSGKTGKGQRSNRGHTTLTHLSYKDAFVSDVIRVTTLAAGASNDLYTNIFRLRNIQPYLLHNNYNNYITRWSGYPTTRPMLGMLTFPNLGEGVSLYGSRHWWCQAGCEGVATSLYKAIRYLLRFYLNSEFKFWVPQFWEKGCPYGGGH